MIPELTAALNRLEAYHESLLGGACGEHTTVLSTKMARFISQQIIQIWMTGYGNLDYKVSDDEREGLCDLFLVCGSSIKNPDLNIHVCSGCLRRDTGVLVRQLRRAVAEESINDDHV